MYIHTNAAGLAHGVISYFTERASAQKSAHTGVCEQTQILFQDALPCKTAERVVHHPSLCVFRLILPRALLSGGVFTYMYASI